jgi:hypothetical protein
MDASDLTRCIESCQDCHGGAYVPFFFRLERQPVMLISAMPAVDAMYKPLTSIHFFRRVCAALFGDKHLHDSTQADRYLREFCDGGIYWTHYRKCHDSRVTDFSKLDDRCAHKYLAREVEVQQPQLVVVLGDEIADKIRAIIQSYQIEAIYKPFPRADNAGQFEDVRTRIAPYLKYVEVEQVTGDGAATADDPFEGVLGQSVGLLFEHKALEAALGWRSVDEEDVEALWYRNVVVPNMVRWTKIVNVCSFAESQIKVALYEHELQTGESLGSIRRRFRAIFPTYVGARDPAKKRLAENLVEQLSTLQELRNAIVHAGGFIVDKKWPENMERLPGIFLLAGTVYVSQEGEETLRKLVNDLTDFLCAVTKSSSRVVARHPS